MEFWFGANARGCAARWLAQHARGGAGRLLDAAQHFDGVSQAVGDTSFVFATTARGRGLTKPILAPEEAMRQAAEKIAQGQKVAVLFGPERAGLENEDIAGANALISVPVNPDFPSLNLAQCVLLMAYEWRRAQGQVELARMELAKTQWAEAIEVEKLAQHYEERLEDAGFFFPEAKAPGMKVNLRNMWSRFSLTRADVQMLHGVLRQLVRGNKGQD